MHLILLRIIIAFGCFCEFDLFAKDDFLEAWVVGDIQKKFVVHSANPETYRVFVQSEDGSLSFKKAFSLKTQVHKYLGVPLNLKLEFGSAIPSDLESARKIIEADGYKSALSEATALRGMGRSSPIQRRSALFADEYEVLGIYVVEPGRKYILNAKVPNSDSSQYYLTELGSVSNRFEGVQSLRKEEYLDLKKTNPRNEFEVLNKRGKTVNSVLHHLNQSFGLVQRRAGKMGDSVKSTELNRDVAEWSNKDFLELSYGDSLPSERAAECVHLLMRMSRGN